MMMILYIKQKKEIVRVNHIPVKICLADGAYS